MELKQKRTKAVVTTVVKISDPVKKQLQDKLKALFLDDFILETKEDPSIIGGVKVQMGFTVIDGTIKRKLEQLGRLLAKG
jgi:F-type H+-transporting ATPase subunit delta